MFLLKKNKIKLIYILIVSILLQSNFVFANKKPSLDPEFPDKPIAKEKNSISEGIIYSEMRGLTAKSPTNPTPSNIYDDEKKLYDNYNIDVNTIRKRIEFFSPTYVYALSMAQSNIYGQLMMNGVSIDDVSDLSNTIEGYKTDKTEAKSGIRQYENKKKELIKSGMSESDPIIKNIDSKIGELNNSILQLNLAISQKKYTSPMYYSLNMVNRADKIAGLNSIIDQISKSLTTAILGYLQLEYYSRVLEKLVSLDKRKIDLYEKNITLGNATQLELSNAKLSYTLDLNTYNNIKNQKDNIKRTILLNLGYDQIEDFDKVNIIEPNIDMTMLSQIKPENDYEHAYNSNSEYQSAQKDNLSQKWKSDETNQKIRNNYKNQYRDKVIANLDSKYAVLTSAYKIYEGSKYDYEAYLLDIESAKRKKELSLVSDIESIGLDIQNIQTEMMIKQAKYDLINAYYDYYYATYGILDIKNN